MNSADTPNTGTTAIPTIQLDNDRVTVTEWRFPPGTQTGWHIHPVDIVVVPVTSGTLTVHTREGGATPNPLKAGGSYTRQAGAEHNVVNDGDTEFMFVEIELTDR